MRRTVFLILVVALGVSCTPKPVDRDLGEFESLGPVVGRFIANHRIEVVPGRFWEADEDAKAWSFRGWANLVVHVDEAPIEEGLVFRFVPDESTTAMRFRASWDQQKLGESAVPAAAGLSFEIPPSALTPGLHHLRIDRVRTADSPELKSILDCRFLSIEHAVGETVRTLQPGQRARHEPIRAFLEDGVAGASEEKRGGMLVAGNQSLRFRLTTTQDAELTFMVSALSGHETRFTVEVDGTRKAVNAATRAEELSIPVQPGAHDVRLFADGRDQGLYLWAAPFLRPLGRGTAQPVILITMDTTRKDVLSVYGGPEQASPNIARLAQRATVYDRAWSTAPWTLPSHASIFSGLYPTRHGAATWNTRLDGQHPTLASLARAAGFRTAGFCGGALAASQWGLAQGFELYRDPTGFETKGDRQTELVKAYIDRHEEVPFFLFVNYFDPHALFEAPADIEARFDVSGFRARLNEDSVWGRVSRGDNSAWNEVVSGRVDASPEAVAYLQAAYQAEVAFMDQQIGQLISMLEDRGLFDGATIVLVADHGEFLGEGGFFSHGCRLDPELTEIPLIIKWPGQSAPERDDRLISQVDLFGTLLAELGVEASSRDGIPIGAENRAAFDARTTVFMEEHENRVHPLFEHMAIAKHLYGFQRPQWRQLVWDGGTQCYEASAGGWGPAECEVSWQQRFEELVAVAALPVESEPSSDDGGLTDEMREDLRALGYIE